VVVIRRTWSAADAATAQWVESPHDDLVREVRRQDGTFVQEDGPFREYSRTLQRTDGEIVEHTSFRLGLPWFGWLLTPFARWSLRRRSPDLHTPPGQQPWWAPPDRLDERAVLVLGLLAAASLTAAFVNTIFTQTVNFAADDFGIGNWGQGVAGAVVRCGIVLTLPIALLADRVGRRRMIQFCAFTAPIVCALGALAPSFGVLTATQAVGRPLGLTLDLLVAVMVAEEMPKSSRAYALSMMAMAGGLGAGVCLWALKLADLGDSGWRLVYLVSLIWLVVAADLTRRLPETKRFHLAEHRPVPPIDRRRLMVQCGVALFGSLFIAAASFFQNRYLRDVRGFSGGRIALFSVVTATPAGIGIVVGGKLADERGRRIIGAVSVVGGATFLVISFGVSGWAMWISALLGGLIAGAAVPALTVYRAELFPTGNRGRAAWIVTAAALLGGSIGLLTAGAMLDHGVSHVRVMGTLALGELVVAAMVLAWYPESAHRELEELNPEDVPLPGHEPSLTAGEPATP
jgi:MFS family permease